jgi:hypothetical protein
LGEEQPLIMVIRSLAGGIDYCLRRGYIIIIVKREAEGKGRRRRRMRWRVVGRSDKVMSIQEIYLSSAYTDTT